MVVGEGVKGGITHLRDIGLYQLFVKAKILFLLQQRKTYIDAKL